jgi:hypothetical protein
MSSVIASNEVAPKIAARVRGGGSIHAQIHRGAPALAHLGHRRNRCLLPKDLDIRDPGCREEERKNLAFPLGQRATALSYGSYSGGRFQAITSHVRRYARRLHLAGAPGRDILARPIEEEVL